MVLQAQLRPLLHQEARQDSAFKTFLYVEVPPYLIQTSGNKRVLATLQITSEFVVIVCQWGRPVVTLIQENVCNFTSRFVLLLVHVHKKRELNWLQTT